MPRTSGLSVDTIKPIAEILVEGELSPFEHEALYKRPIECW